MHPPSDPPPPPTGNPTPSGAAERPATEDLFRDEDEDTPIVCHCMVVHEATIRRAIERGARDLELLSEWTHAGLGCGTCRFDLEDMLAEASRGATETTPPPTSGGDPAAP